MVSRGRNHAVLFIDNAGHANKSGYAKDILGCDLFINYYRQFDGSRWISEADHQAVNRLLEENLGKDPAFLHRAGANMEKNGNAFIDFVNKHKNDNWGEYSNSDLVALLKKAHDLSSRIWGGPWVYGYYFYFNDIYLEDFKKSLAAKLKPADLEKIWDYILQPKDITSLGREKLALLKLAREFIKTKEVPDDRIRQHLDKFAFVAKYYFWGEGLTLGQIKAEIKKIFKSGEKNINKDIDNFKTIKLDLGKFGLTRHEIKTIESIKQISYSINFADEAYNYYAFYFEPFFKEFARRLGISYEELVSMRFVEIEESVENNKLSVPPEKLKERYKDHALVFSKDDVYVLSGKELAEYRQELKEETKNDIGEFKGTVAFKNDKPLSGRVTIVKSNEQINSFENGAILVTQMTNPTYLSAMKKSKAIVTDEGGLLCHAAIVARELGIPCVIGTRIATKVLRDGDLVEVDANKGIVKILERAK